MADTPTADLIAQARANNAIAAFQAAEAVLALVPEVLHDALSSEDPDVRRKALVELRMIAQTAEPKQAQITLAPMNFTLVLDDDIQQEPPPKRTRTLEMVEEVPVLVGPPAPPPEAVLAPLDSLLFANDE